MKIIFCNRANWLERPGGDSVQMLKTKEFLEKLYEVKVTIVTDPREIQYFDSPIVHIFNIQSIDESLAFAYEAKKTKKKIVLSPIYWDLSHAKFIDILARLEIFDIHKYFAYIKPVFLFFYELYNLAISKLYYRCNKFRNKGKKLLLLSDVILPNSMEELKLLESFFKISIKNFEVVFNAVDPSVFKNREKVTGRKTEKKVICAARIEPFKNQLSLIKALYEFTNIKIQLVGGVGNSLYYKKVSKIAKKRGNVVIIDKHISQTDLVKLYYENDVHVLPSFRESPGLSSLEALQCGLNIVVSSEEFCPIHTYFKDLVNKRVFICNPYDVNSIKKAVLKALKTTGVIYTQDTAFTWETAAKQTFNAYIRVLKEKENI